VIHCGGGYGSEHRGFVFHGTEDGNSVLSGITIKQGWLEENPPFGNASGGGIYILGASPTITNCVISDNTVKYNYNSRLSGFGGGIYIDDRSCATVANCFIVHNYADDGGGGMEIANNSSAKVINCVFSGNIVRDWRFNNPKYLEKWSNYYCFGGAIEIDNSSPTVTNCTFYNNYAYNLETPIENKTGGIYSQDNSKPDITNCIIWENGIYPMVDMYGANSNVNYCDVEGGYATGTGNINSDPCFINVNNLTGPDGIFGTADDGLRLRTDSPYIDVGNNSQVETDGIETDIMGRIRIADGDHNDEGTISATVDMGAYELPTIWYVDGDAGSGGDGKTWSTAYDDLQDALTNTNIEYGNEIWVGEGTYKPDEGNGQTPDDRDANFLLMEGVALYGGFEGDETARLERDWINNKTILSGDINDVDNDDSYHVVTVGNSAKPEEPIYDVILDGFTIKDGKDAYPYYGSGMYNEFAMNLKVANCVFRDNHHFATMYSHYSTSQITNCIFINNTGRGMYNHYSTSQITNCIFINNTGRGMYNHYCTSQITNSVFSGNTDVGMSHFRGSSRLINCVFTGNTDIGVLITEAGAILTNCIFWGNSATRGHEIYANLSDATFSYCDIEGGSGGIYADSYSTINYDASNIESDPCFFNSSDPDGEDDAFMTADDGLRLASDSPCIDAGDGEVAPGRDITGQAMVNFPGVVGPEYSDMGAYEYPVKIVVMCWIDEAQGESYNDDVGSKKYSACGSILYDRDYANYRNMINSLGGTANIKSGCIVPGSYEGTQDRDNLVPLGYDRPDEVAFPLCSRFPDHDDLDEMVEDFNEIRGNMVPDYLVMSSDDSESMFLIDIWPDQSKYDAFIDRIEAICPDIVIGPPEPRAMPTKDTTRLVALPGHERWLNEMTWLINNAINGAYE
jgi:hypothetical protein